MNRLSMTVALIAVCGLLQGSASPARADSNQSADLSNVFLGHFVAEGVYKDLRGAADRTMHVDIHGTQHGKSLIVATTTVFSDGESRHKTWTFRQKSPGQFVGLRPDLIGVAAVEVSGKDMTMIYKAHVPIKSGQIFDLNFQEHMQRLDETSYQNTMRISWGLIPVGEAHLIIHRVGN